MIAYFKCNKFFLYILYFCREWIYLRSFFCQRFSYLTKNSARKGCQIISQIIYRPVHDFWYTGPIFIKLSQVVYLIKIHICKQFQVSLIIFCNFTDQNTKQNLVYKMSVCNHNHNKPTSVREVHNGLYLSQFWYSYFLPLLKYCNLSIFGVDPNLVCKMYNWTECFFLASHAFLFPKIHNFCF